MGSDALRFDAPLLPLFEPSNNQNNLSRKRAKHLYTEVALNEATHDGSDFTKCLKQYSPIATNRQLHYVIETILSSQAFRSTINIVHLLLQRFNCIGECTAHFTLIVLICMHRS